MSKFLALSVVSTLVLILSACTDTRPSTLARDRAAVEEDHREIARAQALIEKDRAQKARDKASGNWVGQAVNSMALGAHHLQRIEKNAEKSINTQILNQHSTE